jgi:hypothetical protein
MFVITYLMLINISLIYKKLFIFTNNSGLQLIGKMIVAKKREMFVKLIQNFLLFISE